MENERLEKKVLEIIKAHNLELIDFKIILQKGTHVVLGVVDYPSGGVKMFELATINKLVKSFIEEENILGDNFSIEINSPGLDRPLKSSRDFLRIKGQTVSVWLEEPFKDKKYFEGVLLDSNSEYISIKDKSEINEIPIKLIHIGKQKVVL